MAAPLLRAVSWNVRSLRDGSRAVAAVLARLQPDVVVLQEAPRLAGWRTSRALLARRTGLRLVTRDRAAGNLLLVAPHVGVRTAAAVLLPRRPHLHRRAVATAQVVVSGRELLLAGTHLDLDPAARLDSARRVRAALAGPDPVVLGADVNDTPGGPAWAALAAGLHDGDPGGPPFPARRPTRRIDGLFTALPPRRAEVVPTGAASDHLALLAELP